MSQVKGFVDDGIKIAFKRTNNNNNSNNNNNNNNNNNITTKPGTAVIPVNKN